MEKCEKNCISGKVMIGILAIGLISAFIVAFIFS